MKLLEAKSIINNQILLKRTTSSFPVTDDAIAFLQSSLDDLQNIDTTAIKCKNCEFVFSVLHSENGCVNCGALDLTDQINSI